MTKTRQLHPPFRAILARLAELGTARRDDLITTPTHSYSMLHHLVELRYVRSELDPDYHGGRGGKHYVYALTELGRSVLESGVVPRLTTIRRFTATEPPRKEAVAREGCCHRWVIETTWRQPGCCSLCGETREFAPSASGLAVVGGGRVRSSERWAGVS